MTFSECGRRQAEHDVRDCPETCTDVPVSLTSTYCEAPTREEMRHTFPQWLRDDVKVGD